MVLFLNTSELGGGPWPALTQAYMPKDEIEANTHPWKQHPGKHLGKACVLTLSKLSLENLFKTKRKQKKALRSP